MVCDRSMDLNWRAWIGLSMGGLSAVLGGSLIPSAAIAQVIPDSTLGPDTSVVVDIDPSTQFIEGGATRGSNLFHSFLEFNIAPGSALYFNPDSGISDILTRITGPNPSAIEGLLGVNGSANLYLLNPNGILFGPNASLDITGSFHAIAAPYLPLGNSIFSATAPQSSSLLSISPDVSLFNYLTSGDITSSAALSTGQALTLAGNNLQLSNQLQAGSDLTLLASDTVTIRDSADTAFLARSGDDLTVQGTNSIDILALQHLDLTPFVSGQDLTFISDGFISTDAHFESGGNLQFLTLSGAPCNLLSLYDLIISANGDIVFGNYTGVALKVEATGSIQGGNIRITGPDTALISNGTPDQDLLVSSRAAIFRAGEPLVGSGNLPQNTGNTTFSSGVVTGHPPGSIVASGIYTLDNTGGDGGPIILKAQGSIIVDALNSRSFPISGNSASGGTISLSSELGNIDIIFLASGSLSNTGSSGSGGTVDISLGEGDINIEALWTYSFSDLGDAGPGGAVNISLGEGDINIEALWTYSFSDLGDAGPGGEVYVSSQEGNINVNTLQSYSSSNLGNAGPGGEVYVSSQEEGDINVGTLRSFSFSEEGNAGFGGAVDISSQGGDINVGTLRSFSFSEEGNAGSGGSIYLFSRTGNISGRSFLTGSESVLGNSNLGGSIYFSAGNNINLVDSRLYTLSFTRAGNSGDGGEISLLSERGDVNISSGSLVSRSSSRSGNAGNAGQIDITALRGNILGLNTQLISFAFTENSIQTSGLGGNVYLRTGNVLSGLEIWTLSSDNTSGDVVIQGNGNLLIQDVILIASGQVSIPNPFVGPPITLDITDFGQSGNTNITATGNLTFDNVQVLSDANGAAPGGRILIENTDAVTLNNTTLFSDTNASGVGGDIILRNLGSLTLNNSTFTTDTAGATPTSDAGNIVIDNVGVFLMRNNSLVRVNAENGANAGDINIATDFIVGVPGENNDIIANAVGGNGGRIFATATGIYGFTERNGFTFSELRNLSTNDISASSLFARDGEVSLTFEETPSAEDLPSDFLDSDSLISNSCITPDNQVAGSFTIPGAGGLPATPADVTTSNYSTGDVQTLPASGPQSNVEGWQLGDPIVEPDSVAQLTDGRVVLGRRCN
jgi:filamentous hemagglutinin family protein